MRPSRPNIKQHQTCIGQVYGALFRALACCAIGCNVGSPLSLNGVWQPLLDFANLCDNKQSYSRRFGRGEQYSTQFARFEPPPPPDAATRFANHASSSNPHTIRHSGATDKECAIFLGCVLKKQLSGQCNRRVVSTELMGCTACGLSVLVSRAMLSRV